MGISNLADDFISDKAWAIQWEIFSKFSNLEGAPEIQKSEMRKAFFFGIGAALTGMKVLSNIEDEEFGASIFDGWNQEFRDFCEEIQAEAISDDRN